MRPDSKVTCVKINELNTSYSDIIFSLSPIKGNDEPVSYNARINLPGLSVIQPEENKEPSNKPIMPGCGFSAITPEYLRSLYKR